MQCPLFNPFVCGGIKFNNKEKKINQTCPGAFLPIKISDLDFPESPCEITKFFEFSGAVGNKIQKKLTLIDNNTKTKQVKMILEIGINFDLYF